MRKRNIRIQVRLNEIEYEKLLDGTEKTKLNMSDYIRRLIMNVPIKEKPDYEFYNIMKELSKIGVNLNQIAHKANATNVIDKEKYETLAKEWLEFSKEVKKKYL